MPARVFVTGASGFVGTAVVRELVSRNFEVNALVNHRNLKDVPDAVRSFQGSIFDQSALDSAMAGCDGVIHLVGIIMERPSKGVTFKRIHFEGTQSVVDATRRAGIKRYLHMSALGTRANAASEYHKTKFEAEEYVRSTDLDWTIFRPSLIHGPQGEFMQMEVKWARHAAAPFLFMPYFGGGILGQRGAGMLQPVFVDDVARAFVDSIGNHKTVRQIYPVAGSERVSWPGLHTIVSRAIVGRKRWTLPLPVWLGKFYAATGIAPLLGFNRDQVIMSQEDNTADIGHFVEDFGWTPRGFEAAFKQYAPKLLRESA